MAKTDPINVANPAGSTNPRLGDDYIRALARANIELLGVDHHVGAETSNAYDEDDAGEHSKITFHAPLADLPANKTTNSDDGTSHEGYLYTKDAENTSGDDKAELHWQDEDGNHIQMTAEGNNYLEKPLIPNATAIRAKNNAGDGFVEICSVDTYDKVAFLTKTKLPSGSLAVNSDQLAFSSGSTLIAVGAVVTGHSSGATGHVTHVTLSSGSWAGGDAAGILNLLDVTGTFASETLDIGGTTDVATAGTFTAGTSGVIATEDYVDNSVPVFGSVEAENDLTFEAASDGFYWGFAQTVNTNPKYFKIDIDGTFVLNVLLDSSVTKYITWGFPVKAGEVVTVVKEHADITYSGFWRTIE